MTEDQAASELLKQWGVGEEALPESAEEEESTDEPADEATSSEEEDSTEAESESGEVEIDVAGEKFKLPPAVAEQAKRIEAKAKEVEAGATRKFQEAADLRKAAEISATQAQQQQHFNQAQAHLLGELTLVQRRMQLFEQMDLNAYAEDPAQLTRINAEYNQLRSAKERIGMEIQRVYGLFTKDQQDNKAKRLLAAQEFAKANIKDFGTDNMKRHAAYAEKRGIPSADMTELLLQDPRLALILDDAEYGARVKASKPEQTKRITDATKTLKPGAGGQSKLTAANNALKANQRLQKSGRVEDAALALLARSKRR
jgi:hypothetical protein